MRGDAAGARSCSITAPKLAAYVSQTLADEDTVNGNALPLPPMNSFAPSKVLQSVAMAMDSGSVRLASDARRLAHGFDVRIKETKSVITLTSLDGRSRLFVAGGSQIT